MNKEEFKKSLLDLNILCDCDKLNKLDKYYKLLIEENKKYNLTAITNEEDVYLKHFYDSLTTVKIINLTNQKICDIGTGAGFPGIVLKIFFPNLEVTLLDATEKKCNFLNKVITELKLEKINVINERAEIYSKNTREIYDIVISRAVAPLKHLLEYSIPLLKINGNFISLKSNIDNEIEDIENYQKKLNLSTIETINFLLPIENSNRTLIKFTKENSTNMKYPRSYKEIKKSSI